MCTLCNHSDLKFNLTSYVFISQLLISFSILKLFHLPNGCKDDSDTFCHAESLQPNWDLLTFLVPQTWQFDIFMKELKLSNCFHFNSLQTSCNTRNMEYTCSKIDRRKQFWFNGSPNVILLSTCALPLLLHHNYIFLPYMCKLDINLIILSVESVSFIYIIQYCVVILFLCTLAHAYVMKNWL